MNQSFYHIRGHLDQILDLSELTLEELVNVECDIAADKAISAGDDEGEFIDQFFPNEDLVILGGDRKVSGQLAPIIALHWGQARVHYNNADIIPHELFDAVDWDNLEKVMKPRPEMWSVWVTKHISNFCGTNHMLQNIYRDVANRCSSCGCTLKKKAIHIVHCHNLVRMTAYYSSVDKLQDWMKKEQTCLELAFLIKCCLSVPCLETRLEMSPRQDIFVFFLKTGFCL